MPLQFEEMAEGSVLEAHVSGRLTDEDYRQFAPEVEKIVNKHGKIRMLTDMHDFHGWNTSGLWEEFKLDVRHAKNLERLAIVGEKKWQEWMSRVCQPFTDAEIRYFDRSDMAQAQTWIQNN